MENNECLCGMVTVRGNTISFAWGQLNTAIKEKWSCAAGFCNMTSRYHRAARSFFCSTNLSAPWRRTMQFHLRVKQESKSLRTLLPLLRLFLWRYVWAESIRFYLVHCRQKVYNWHERVKPEGSAEKLPEYFPIHLEYVQLKWQIWQKV